MGIAKDLISAPLEAGTSLLDSQKLPPQLNQALEYVSNRLMRKSLHLTLIVVKHDLPQATLCPPTPSSLPSRSPSALSFSKLHLPSLPGSPKSFTSSASSSRAASPSSLCFPSSTTPTTPIPQSANPYGITLHHAATMSPKATRHLNDTIAKASKKFSLGNDWLSAPSTSPSSPTSPTSPDTLSNDLIRRSLQQNEVLFSSEGLTLLTLDRVYTFKSALSAYSRTLQPTSSTHPAASSSAPPTWAEKLASRTAAKILAVDELRLLVLSQKNRRISQSYLLRAYDHLSILLPALRSVNEAYKTCFHADGIDIEDVVRPVRVETQRLVIPEWRTASGCMPGGWDLGPHVRAPDTPAGYDDVTPVTRGEWNILMDGRGVFGKVEVF